MKVIVPEDRMPGAEAEGRRAPDRVDLRGLKCPLPALRTEKALARLPASREMTVLADDPLARLDIAHLCRAGGHTLLSVEALETGGWRFHIRRGDRAMQD